MSLKIEALIMLKKVLNYCNASIGYNIPYFEYLTADI